MEVSGVKIKMCGNWLGVAIGPGYPLLWHKERQGEYSHGLRHRQIYEWRVVVSVCML